VPLFGVVFFVTMYALVAWSFTPPQQIILGAKGLEVLDRNGNSLFTFTDEPGSSRIVPLDQVSPDLVNATVAAEDAGFWKNPGVSVTGLMRAAYENLAFWKYGGLFKGSGGSSITQQLAKNVYIKPQDRARRNPIRKLEESILAFELSRRYSKQQIIEWYLSDVYYGNGAYGIESASYRYFNKPPHDLSLPEAAMLAGIPRAPAVYDPIADIDRAKERQKQVLGLMVQRSLLTPDQAGQALAAPLALREGRNPNLKTGQDFLAPHFAAYVRELLPALIGKDHVKGQLRVTTTIDSQLQSKAESIVKTQLDKDEKQYSASNGALVSIDPASGEIMAMVGSHDFFRDDISGQVNNALSLREPGSTMKPITYLTAFLKGWAPSTMIVDEAIKVPNGDSSYILNNADGRYRGAVPIRVALGSSLNVPAVKTLEFVGLQNVYAAARRMGISTLKDLNNYGPSFTLGGLGTDLLDMTYVYTIFANQGQQAGIDSVLDLPKGSRSFDPVAVLKVESVDGKVLYKAHERSERVVQANAAYLITNILSDDSARVSGFGANSALNLSGRPAAAKSGSSDATRDAWTIGYTPQLVTGVWVGNADNRPMPGATSTNTAAPIWNAFMLFAHEGKAVVNFQVPDGIEFAKVCATTGQAPASDCPKVVDEVFLAGRTPKGAKDVAPTQVAPTARPATPVPPTTAPPPPLFVTATPAPQPSPPIVVPTIRVLSPTPIVITATPRPPPPRGPLVPTLPPGLR
jgi:membrane peptidoglycan carboxypeptidase